MAAALDWLLFGSGWTLGWLMLWRTRPLPPGGASREAVAVVVPARDEAAALPAVLVPLVAAMRDGDELVVVDDGSSDGTASTGRVLGATVITAPPVPTGWIGKAHACWCGATATRAPILVFVDADVRPATELLDRLAAALRDAPDAVVSVQPWHDVGGAGERASILLNVVTLMGSGGFTVLGRHIATSVAFGPILAVRRDRYIAAGGHAAVAVRSSLTEDIQLARAVGSSRLYTSARDATFRMYPGGFGETWRGWSRTIANGVAATRWWLVLAIAGWVWALAGAPFVGWGAYALAAVQVGVLGRRAGRCGPLTAVLYPLCVVALVGVLASAACSRRSGRTSWKGRTVRTTG